MDWVQFFTAATSFVAAAGVVVVTVMQAWAKIKTDEKIRALSLKVSETHDLANGMKTELLEAVGKAENLKGAATERARSDAEIAKGATS